MAMQAEREQRSSTTPARLLPVTQTEAKPARRTVASR
jgi:hypothetical protein